MGRSVSAEDGHPGGAERWLSIHDELLRAMAHAVSNRLATISAVASLLEAGGTADARLLEGLRTESERLEGLLRRPESDGALSGSCRAGRRRGWNPC